MRQHLALALLLGSCTKPGTAADGVAPVAPSAEVEPSSETNSLVASYDCKFDVAGKLSERTCEIVDGSKQGSEFLLRTTDDSTLRGSVQSADFGFRFVGDLELDGAAQQSEADFFRQGGRSYACALVTSEGVLVKISLKPISGG